MSVGMGRTLGSTSENTTRLMTSSPNRRTATQCSRPELAYMGEQLTIG